MLHARQAAPALSGVRPPLGEEAADDLWLLRELRAKRHALMMRAERTPRLPRDNARVLGGIVRGKRTALRVPTEADLAGFARWAADLHVRGALTRAYWDEPAMLATWKERLAKQSEDKSSTLWAIDGEGALAGSCRVEYAIEPGHFGNDGIGITHFTIEPDRWGQGLGSDAALALHRWIFDIVHARFAHTALAAHNAGALRVAERLGYETYARGTAVHYGDGRYVDGLQLRMDLTTWDERWGATEREYPVPLGEELEA